MYHKILYSILLHDSFIINKPTIFLQYNILIIEYNILIIDTLSLIKNNSDNRARISLSHFSCKYLSFIYTILHFSKLCKNTRGIFITESL